MKRTVPFKPDLVEGPAFEGFRILPKSLGRLWVCTSWIRSRQQEDVESHVVLAIAD